MVSFSRESNNRTEPPADNDIKITSVFSSTIQFDFYCLLLYAAFQRQHFLLLRADFLFRFSAFRRVVLFLRVRVSDLNDDDDDDLMCTCRISRVVLHEREKRRIGKFK